MDERELSNCESWKASQGRREGYVTAPNSYIRILVHIID